VIDFATVRGIGIENKPWAGDEPEQVMDYLAYLRSRYGDRYLFIYLSDGHIPTSISREEWNRLSVANVVRQLSYHGEVTEWLEKCRQQCSADKVRWFLGDLIRFVATEIPSEMSERGEV
jgi:hypothetical protein